MILDFRKERLEELFIKHIIPFTDKTLSKSGIKKLAEKFVQLFVS